MMIKETMYVNFDVYVWECQCGHRFAIMNVMPDGSFGHWGNPKYTPFCPHCAIKLEAGEND